MFRSDLPDHPCMNDRMHGCMARIHLPVAHRCNIRCGYCERRVGLLPDDQERPGTCEQIMAPSDAVDEVRDFLSTWGEQSIVGIAGPGDPLANDETFETLELIRSNLPETRLCLCTNGLNLPDSIKQLKASGLGFLSVTVNAVDSAIGAQIHPWVESGGLRLRRGIEASSLLLERQLKGIDMAVQSGMVVKVNSVVIPGVNDHHIPDVAQTASRLGVRVFNPMPLIPAGVFSHLMAPGPAMMKQLYRQCSDYLTVFRSCKQCRADARGIPGKDRCTWKKTA